MQTPGNIRFVDVGVSEDDAAGRGGLLGAVAASGFQAPTTPQGKQQLLQQYTVPSGQLFA